MSTVSTLAPTDTPAWIPVATGQQRRPWARRPSIADLTLYATDAPGGLAPVGELWLTREHRTGRWHTRTPRFGVSTGHATRGEALAAVGMLDTVPAFTLADMVGQASNGVRVILPDGTVGMAFDARHHTYGTDACALRAVTVAVYHLDTVATLEHPSPLAGATLAARTRTRTENGQEWRVTRVTVRAGAPVALTPPCAECGADSGRHHETANCATDWL